STHLLGIRHELSWIETSRRADSRIIGAKNTQGRRLDDHEYEIKRAYDVKIGRERFSEARTAPQRTEDKMNDPCKHEQRHNLEDDHARDERCKPVLLAKLRKLQQETERD